MKNWQLATMVVAILLLLGTAAQPVAAQGPAPAAAIIAAQRVIVGQLEESGATIKYALYDWLGTMKCRVEARKKATAAELKHMDPAGFWVRSRDMNIYDHLHNAYMNGGMVVVDLLLDPSFCPPPPPPASAGSGSPGGLPATGLEIALLALLAGWLVTNRRRGEQPVPA